jgi:hypothetical protein
MRKFEDGRDFDWDDLGQLLRRTIAIDRDRITGDCVRAFGFLADLTDDEHALARTSISGSTWWRRDCVHRNRRTSLTAYSEITTLRASWERQAPDGIGRAVGLTSWPDRDGWPAVDCQTHGNQGKGDADDDHY